jgi:predicted phosphodiesterase
VLAVVLVALASAFGGLLAVWSYSASARLSVGTVSLSVSPFHRGALDVYVPLVDWGVRFPGVHAPARLQVRLDTVDRAEARRVAREGLPATDAIRREARGAIAGYLLRLAVLSVVGAVALGALAAAALRTATPGLRGLLGAAGSIAAAWALVVALALAPRGSASDPTYYAHGSDIPIALRAIEAASRSAGELGGEIDDQLLGLARLVVAPGNRVPLAGLPRLTIASDLHNNVVAISAVRRAAGGGPVVLAGDLTDRGTPQETAAVRTVARAGRPVIFVAGNHDSDRSERRLAQAGAIVLTRRGRLGDDGRRIVVRAAGLRFAGYESPNVRRAAQDYRDRGAQITRPEQQRFSAWLSALVGAVDVVVVHEPQLARLAVDELRRHPPASPVLIVTGHTHRQALDSRAGVVEVNGGTAGAGGTGNLGERQPVGLAVVTYERPSTSTPFRPLAVDFVRIAPGTGEATAQRVRLDDGPVRLGDL